MKNNIPIEILIVCSSLLIILIVVFIINPKTNNTNYSAYNTNKSGTGLIFDTMKNLGYPVKISREPINNFNNDDIYIIIEPQALMSDEYIYDMLDFVYYGGNLILLTSHVKDIKNMFLDFEDQYLSENMFNEFEIYSLGDGNLVLGNGNGLQNENLMSNKKAGYDLLEILLDFQYINIYFSEYYHGYSTSPSLWSDTPISIKLIFYQFLIVIILIIIYLGKRFGKPIPYYENEQRIENEYVIALANLYQEAGFGEIVIENYYNDFIKRCSQLLNENQNDLKLDLEALWKQKKLPNIEYVNEIQNFVSSKNKVSTKKKKEIKQFNSLIAKMNSLNTALDKYVGLR